MLKKLLSKIFNFNQQMQDKIEWQKTNEPILLSWTGRGIEGNKKDLLLRKMAFITVILFLGILPIILALVKSKTGLDIVIAICGMGIVGWPIIFMMYFFTIAGKFYTYRITKETVELASWKDGMPKAKEVIQLFLWIISPFIFIVFITEPSALLVSLGGMTGVGILAGVTFFSKGYIESHLDCQHMITRWDSLLKIEIDNRGKPIILVWGKDFYDKKQRVDLFNLFCTPEIVKLIQQQVKEEALEKGIHYCETWG